MTLRLPHLLLPLLFALCAAAPALAQTDGLVEGRDYVVIAGGAPLQATKGKIEVVEVFAYWCHVCNDFQPLVDTWTKTLPRDVAFRYLPAAFDPNDGLARAYFASESMGKLARTHHATFRAIHVEQSLPARGATAAEIGTLYATLGIDAKRLANAMQSKATDARMQAAREFMIGAGVEGTPTMIVNGKYRVKGRSLADMLRHTDLLVARERAAAKAR
ncbi:thiol:disulfide interchange protein DsbA/DsbL [Luteimonas sp. MC1782]|uniref:thiol:disulfide interchange protein DsbA/DsbL n=1 Tax=Luteimonas sp. MC1782 TaxID=2760305 RepID=UPI0015FFC022|nr:thiol:disulfide interchange protein DsbA/DsbL [Luteimonas sp. MC1782]MBB1473059.1 thiol:disulfide interchange protein DsbA/DsbL [Luteimonas sp. MC1782]